jgi:hypothetical protein
MLMHSCQCCECNEVYDVLECGGILRVDEKDGGCDYECLKDVHCPYCDSKDKIELEVY